MTVPSADVAVIGCGPTGATLAGLLAKCGLRVAVLEREAAIHPLPRAVHFDDEVMRVFQALGVAERLEEVCRVNPGMRFVDASDGSLLLDWPRPQEVGPQGWHASYRFHQPDLEAILRGALAEAPRVTLTTGAEVAGITEEPERVRLTLRDGRAVTACYAVGCDGARSMLRGAIGGGMEDLGFHERWLVTDLRLTRPRPDLGDHSVQFCDPDRPMTYVRCPGDRRRWEGRLAPGERAEEAMRPERVWQRLARWITPAEAEIERAAVYTFRSAIARRWRRGRLLIAGDAAHLTPPFMGQGMCAGIRDAANLAWKLALRVREEAGDALLDSYGAERIPHVRAYIETAVRLGHLINALDRDGALQLAEDRAAGRVRMASIAPALGESAAARFGAPPSEATGRLAAQPVLSDGRRLDDVTGYAPVLLSRAPLPGPPRGPLRVDAGAEPGMGVLLDSLGAEAVLIRPDRYVVSTAETESLAKKLSEVVFPSPLPAASP